MEKGSADGGHTQIHTHIETHSNKRCIDYSIPMQIGW